MTIIETINVYMFWLNGTYTHRQKQCLISTTNRREVDDYLIGRTHKNKLRMYLD